MSLISILSIIAFTIIVLVILLDLFIRSDMKKYYNISNISSIFYSEELNQVYLSEHIDEVKKTNPNIKFIKIGEL